MDVVSKLKRISSYPAFKALCIVIVLALLGVLFADKIAMPVLAGRYADRANVPNVTALSAEEAEKSLIVAGFQVEWSAESRYSSEVPDGHVLVQTPVAGRIAKLGRTVILVKSKGLREVEISDLRGKSQKQASMFISRAGLIEGIPLKSAHVSIPRGVVIRTIPSAGTFVRIGDTVRVVISAGEKGNNILLPNVLDMPLDSAKASLTKLGFNVNILLDSLPERIRGTVVGLNPRYGEYLPKGTSIDLHVAK